MHIVFACPGMPFRGDTVETGSLGGSETACYYVAKEMAALGHKVLVFTTHPEASGNWDGVDYAFVGPQSERYPLGEYLHVFMESTYMDAMVLQRASGVMVAPHVAKTAFWWLHDIALLRALHGVRADLYQYDGLLSVSEWHKEQIASTWELNRDHIHVMPNSVDRSLYDRVAEFSGDFNMLYQSRPERGIDYLIKPGGIMEQLHKKRPKAHLYVCGYDNTTDQMAPYYQQVWRRIDELPNCTLLGHMPKRELAAVQRGVDLLVYPSEFEETSCITAMEAQAAGLPMVASACGALPETCGSGAKLIPLKDGKCDQESFVEFLAKVDRKTLDTMSRYQLESADRLDWRQSAEILDELIRETIEKKQRNRFSMVRTMLDRSDIGLLDRYGVEGFERHEYESKYAFRSDLKSHYDADEPVSELEKDSSLDMSGNRRFMEAAQHLFEANPSHVLDYGCQKGHYVHTLALIKHDIQYVGVDISPRIIEWAKKHNKVPGADIKFKSGDVLSEDFDYSEHGKYDGLVLGEVVEHVPDAVKLMERLAPLLTAKARVVITTPFGDWEGKDFHNNPDGRRYHLHHFERADLDEMFGHQDNYLTTCVPAGRSDHEPLGSWVTRFDYNPEKPIAKEINWDRKLSEFVPRETMSFCALSRNAESTILRSLLSAREVADEFIIALDKTTTDNTRQVLERFRDQHCRFKRFVILDAESPLEIGFDAARNRTLEHARGDWIMWMDNDEDLIYPERLHKYLRHNQYDGYSIAQNHMSADPVGVLTTDWPVRVFRNRSYLKFSGVVHEHPDDVEHPNSGPRHPAMLGDLHILHHGYTTEAVRRQRFQRNLPLIKRDRKQNPDRLLGKMLWMRDLSHMCMFGAEQTGGYVTDDMRRYAEEGIKIFEDLLNSDEPIAGRMARDGVEYYSNLVSVLGEGFEVDLQLHAAKQFGQANKDVGPRRKGRFRKREHFEKFLKSCCDEQMQGFETRYW